MAVLLAERRDEIFVVTLNRPDRLNALDAELIDALAVAWDEARDPAIRAVVITGAGRGFCAGADLRQPAGGVVRAGGIRRSMNPLMMALLALEKLKCLANNLTCRLVAARLYATLQERVKFRGQRDIDSSSVGRHV